MIDEQKVYDYLFTIPKGKVVTYRMIALFLGNQYYARRVGTLLHNNPDTLKYPCYKVVNSKGKLACHFKDGIEIQKKRLEEDGIEVNEYTVDLNKYLWKQI